MRTEPKAVPFYATPVSQLPPTRRLLLITYYFPPYAVVGGIRWQKLARYAVERGWGVDVICLDPQSYTDRDDGRLLDLPVDVRVYGVSQTLLLIERVLNRLLPLYRAVRKSPPQSAANSVARSEVRNTRRGPREIAREIVRACFAYLEFARVRQWARTAADLGLDFVGPEHQAVITSGPPHMAHEAGYIIAQRTGLPFVMDMRDPWSVEPWVPEPISSPVHWWLAAKHERRMVGAASLVVTNTELAARVLRNLYPPRQDRIVTVMNGCDEGPLPASNRGRMFVIAYAGTIYLDRDPRPLFRGAARVIRELGLSPDDFSIKMIGYIDHLYGVPVTEIARQEGIERFVSIGAQRPYQETMQFLADAHMLVVLPQGSDMAIPAKVFEYMRFDAWLLAFAPPESAICLALAGSGADIVDPRDSDGITEAIRRRYLEHARGVRATAIAGDSRFSRRAQAEILLDGIEALTGRPYCRPAHAACDGRPRAAGDF